MTWTLRTARLDLRPLGRDDAGALAEVFTDPVAMRFYPAPFDAKLVTSWIERQLERYERDGFGLLGLVERATGSLIGDCGPAVQQTGHGTHVELGWHVLRARQGHGFATEAGAACRDEAFKRLGVDHLISIIRPENVPSWRVARALGFAPWRGDVRVGMAHVLWRLDRGSLPGQMS